ncbi:DUF4430 domain-containing protein [Denitrobacterium detoxificans]|jgi:hypothetical protein|uniref:DUF4430 domain-containing protein n=1 Tax=Denitrobacterium detoxificans TaxID=79604 RepID=UPI0026F1B38B|nr:DUF4430 domain-containing protein [Denitrobacterium detoxificans]MBE6465592.1 DUF4430 domain-containing protein [Denitrobacterium detoxificans]
MPSSNDTQALEETDERIAPGAPACEEHAPARVGAPVIAGIALAVVLVLACVGGAVFASGSASQASQGQEATSTQQQSSGSAEANQEQSSSQATTSDQGENAQQEATQEASAEGEAAGDQPQEQGAASDASGASSQAAGSSESSGASSGEAAPASQEPASQQQEAATVTVTLTIDSSNAHAYNSDYPSSMGSKTLTLEEGATVWDALNAMGVSVRGSATYVRAINGLSEFDCGNSSGWMYKVNGSFPTKTCGNYVLSDGDSVLWAYTCTMGDV